MLEKIQETADFLREKMHTSPETAIILGTGLGSLVHEITDKYEISYKDIPNFPVSTVEGHSGKLIFGKLGNKDIMAMQGRFHFYEGYSMKEVTFASFTPAVMIFIRRTIAAVFQSPSAPNPYPFSIRRCIASPGSCCKLPRSPK